MGCLVCASGADGPGVAHRRKIPAGRACQRQSRIHSEAQLEAQRKSSKCPSSPDRSGKSRWPASGNRCRSGKSRGKLGPRCSARDAIKKRWASNSWRVGKGPRPRSIGRLGRRFLIAGLRLPRQDRMDVTVINEFEKISPMRNCRTEELSLEGLRARASASTTGCDGEKNTTTKHRGQGG